MDLYNVTLLTDLSLDFLIDTLEQAGRSLVIFYEETEAHPCRICGLIGHMVNFLWTKPWTIYPAWRVVQTKQFYKSTRNNRSWEEVRLRLLDKLIVK